jgi:hypothetical protein
MGTPPPQMPPTPIHVQDRRPPPSSCLWTLLSVLVLVLLLWGSVTARAQPQQLTQPTVAFGIGRLSCASWLNNPAEYADGAGWILGYWTGLNVYNPDSHTVGRLTNGTNILTEVELLCRRRPAVTIIEVEAEVYERVAAREAPVRR